MQNSAGSQLLRSMYYMWGEWWYNIFVNREVWSYSDRGSEFCRVFKWKCSENVLIFLMIVL